MRRIITIQEEEQMRRKVTEDLEKQVATDKIIKQKAIDLLDNARTYLIDCDDQLIDMAIYKINEAIKLLR